VRPNAFTLARLRAALDKSLWLGVYCNYSVAAHRHCCRAQTLLGQGPEDSHWPVTRAPAVVVYYGSDGRCQRRKGL